MTGLPGSLSIALSLVGSIWLVGVVALLAGAPGELVTATFVVGLMQRGELWPAAAYIAASVALAILALFAGLLLVRSRVDCQLRARPSRHPEERGARLEGCTARLVARVPRSSG